MSTERGEAETSGNAFLFGLSAGLRVFGTDAFSIDPPFAFLRSSGSTSLEPANTSAPAAAPAP